MAISKVLDWRIIFGLVLTTVWITTGLVYLLGIVGWQSFVELPTADIGSFLEGAFAPLAFLWLVIGHFMQQREISTNTKAINIQELSARRLELHSRRDSYFKLLSLVQQQLGVIASLHYVSVCGPTGTGEITQEEFSEQRTKTSTADHSFFIRKMIIVAINAMPDTDALQEIFYGTEIRKRHSDNFEKTFKKLHLAAESVDYDELISDALMNGSAEGRLYSIIRHVNGSESIDPLLANAALNNASTVKDEEQKNEEQNDTNDNT